MTRALRAVLWDMDGTIVDTEPYWMAAEVTLVESFGGSWTDEQALQLVGKGLHDSAGILQAAGVEMEADAIVQHMTDAVRTALATQGVPFRPGARELLQQLRDAGIRSGLVTMSLRRMAQDIVDLIGFDAFEIVVGGDDVSEPKPHPEPYLRGAELLGVDIADVVVLEDSPTGIGSGVSSGAVTIGVPHIVPLDGLGAHELWETLAGRTPEDLVAVFQKHRAVREGISA